MHWSSNRRRGRPPHPDILTPAEWRILEQVREGCTNAEIAARTGLSFHTVKTHVANILAKTGTPDRRALAAWQGVPVDVTHRQTRAFALPLAGWLSGVKAALAVGGVVLLIGMTAAVFAVLAGDPDDALSDPVAELGVGGGTIAFSAGGSIYTVNGDGSELTELVPGSTQERRSC